MKFNIGDTVRVIKMNWAGTVIYFDKKTEKYLVRVNGVEQFYYSDDEIELWKK
ncbi:hypothetical protein Q2T76_07785 [Lactobacillus sp. YT155]|uniref:hypothetical protein n=1 Tax=Lactobacillus sp. YT155 TaxID=3060955 RepID=UPI00265E75E9|nr:hypothetical protein [Lactobacillus sp. YT155]MDO1605936.1 hypothetical protein [Lactobacillus sp. YT155]